MNTQKSPYIFTIIILIIIVLGLTTFIVFSELQKNNHFIEKKSEPMSVTNTVNENVENRDDKLMTTTNTNIKQERQREIIPDFLPVDCPDPFVFQLPIDITKATSVLYPGQIRGGEYKAHGGFRFDKSKPEDITVRAPYDARIIAGARYPVEGGAIQYAFDFEHPCGIRYRFMHLLTLTPKFQAIAETFPLPKVADSRTTQVYPPVEVELGEVIATAVGVPYGGFNGGPNVFVDWGVYDYRKLNDATKDPEWAKSHPYETYQYAVCWFDWISADDLALVHKLPPADGKSGSQSDYCK